MPPLLTALRPRQWTKNAVVLAPVIFAFGDPAQGIGRLQVARAGAAAFLFCMLSSAVYLLNDLLDVERDRAHPVKRHRPIAAGTLTPALAGAAAAVLAVTALAGTLALSTGCFGVLLAYGGLQAAYSVLLKRVALVDVFVIAAGFVLRAMAGALATPVPISPWLLLCAMLLALFLALCKRRHEKVVLQDAAPSSRPALDQYDVKLLDQLIAIVCAATIVCYAVYTQWPDTVTKFGTRALGLTVPLVIFGLFRYLDLVYRHRKGDQPEQILLTDVPLLVDLALYGATVVAVLRF